GDLLGRVPGRVLAALRLHGDDFPQRLVRRRSLSDPDGDREGLRAALEDEMDLAGVPLSAIGMFGRHVEVEILEGPRLAVPGQRPGRGHLLDFELLTFVVELEGRGWKIVEDQLRQATGRNVRGTDVDRRLGDAVLADMPVIRRRRPEPVPIVRTFAVVCVAPLSDALAKAGERGVE